MWTDSSVVTVLGLIVVASFNSSFAEIQSLKSVDTLSNLELFSVDNNRQRSSCLRNVSQCSPWSYCDNKDGTCHCFHNTDLILTCDAYGNRDSIISCYCLTLNELKNTTELGLCIFNCDYLGKSQYNINSYVPLPDSVFDLDKVCSLFNRTGTLCGQCINNTYLRAYSYDMSCTYCKGGWSSIFQYLAIAYIPLTLFYIIVLLLQLNIHSSSIQGYIFFSQMVSSPFVARLIFVYLKDDSGLLLTLTKVFGSMFGIWNLDFFRVVNLDICFQVHPLTILSLDFFVAVYPLLLIAVTYVLTIAHDSNFWLVVLATKPFKKLFRIYKTKWNVRTSTVDAFATFILLSNVKFVCFCFDLLAPVQVCNTSRDGKCIWAPFYAATIPYLGREHLPFAIFAFVVLVVFVIIPILVLILYPLKFCHSLFNCLPRRWQILLHVFTDSFQGCYKNGTEPGTQDFRWFSAVPFIVRLILLTLYSIIINSSAIEFMTMILAVTVILIILMDPYKDKDKELSSHQASFILFLGSVFILAKETSSINVQSYFVIGGLILLLQLIYISTLTVRWIVNHRQFGLKGNHCFFN